MIRPERKYIVLGKDTNINMKRSDYYTIQELRKIMHLSTAGVYKEDGEWRPNQATEMRSNSFDFTDLLKQLLE